MCIGKAHRYLKPYSKHMTDTQNSTRGTYINELMERAYEAMTRPGQWASGRAEKVASAESRRENKDGGEKKTGPWD